MGAKEGKAAYTAGQFTVVNRTIRRLYNRVRINLLYLLLSPQERNWLIEIVAEHTRRVWHIYPAPSGVRIIGQT